MINAKEKEKKSCHYGLYIFELIKQANATKETKLSKTGFKLFGINSINTA